MTLDQLPLGQQGIIQKLEGQGAFRRRLLEVGLLPGTPIVRTGQAPLGDPLSFRVRGAILSIRRSEALSIWLQKP